MSDGGRAESNIGFSVLSSLGFEMWKLAFCSSLRCFHCLFTDWGNGKQPTPSSFPGTPESRQQDDSSKKLMSSQALGKSMCPVTGKIFVSSFCWAVAKVIIAISVVLIYRLLTYAEKLRTQWISAPWLMSGVSPGPHDPQSMSTFKDHSGSWKQLVSLKLSATFVTKSFILGKIYIFIIFSIELMPLEFF